MPRPSTHPLGGPSAGSGPSAGPDAGGGPSAGGGPLAGPDAGGDPSAGPDAGGGLSSDLNELPIVANYDQCRSVKRRGGMAARLTPASLSGITGKYLQNRSRPCRLPFN